MKKYRCVNHIKGGVWDVCAKQTVFMASKTHEYVAKEGSRDLFCCRAPHGARGLKRQDMDAPDIERGRAPHGARGLKRPSKMGQPRKYESRPARGAWIETVAHRAAV